MVGARRRLSRRQTTEGCFELTWTRSKLTLIVAMWPFLYFVQHQKSSQWCQEHFLNYKGLLRAVTVREQLRRLMNKFKVPRTSSEGTSFMSSDMWAWIDGPDRDSANADACDLLVCRSLIYSYSFILHRWSRCDSEVHCVWILCQCCPHSPFWLLPVRAYLAVYHRLIRCCTSGKGMNYFTLGYSFALPGLYETILSYTSTPTLCCLERNLQSGKYTISTHHML